MICGRCSPATSGCHFRRFLCRTSPRTFDSGPTHADRGRHGRRGPAALLSVGLETHRQLRPGRPQTAAGSPNRSRKGGPCWPAKSKTRLIAACH
jgi:hypothetical protein